jgi:hypothetical protein
MSRRPIRLLVALAACYASLGAANALASGGTPPPTLAPGPCATIAPMPKLITVTTVFAPAVTLNTTITSCSSLTQSGLAVGFDGGTTGTNSQTGNTGPTHNGLLFTCGAPENATGGGSYTLSPGATVGVTCHQTGFNVIDANDFGQGTATLYSDCSSAWIPSGLVAYPFLTSLGDPSSTCTQALASTAYTWDVAIPLPNGGGQVFGLPSRRG